MVDGLHCWAGSFLIYIIFSAYSLPDIFKICAVVVLQLTHLIEQTLI